MRFEEKINKLLDQADEAREKGDFVLASDRYLKVAELYFAQGERAENVETAQKCLNYGKAFARAAQVLEKS